MKTILVFSWFYHPFIGGAELFVRAIAERLSSRFRFIILTARTSRNLPRKEKLGEGAVLRVGTGHWTDKFIYPVPALMAALHNHSVDLVHPIMVNAASLTAYFYLQLRDKPSLLTLQEGDSEEYVKSYLGPFFAIYPKLHRPFDRIHAISSFLRNQAVGYGADPATISVVPNGVDTDIFTRSAWSSEKIAELRRDLGLEGKRVIISVSRLVAKNAIEDLVRALPSVAASHPDVTLLLVGDGEQRSRLEGLASELGIRERVRFAGAIEHRETAKYILLSEVFVRPSASEGLGSAFLEAMACEVPVVGTPVGGVVDFLREEETGLFCKPHCPESVASAIDRFLDDRALASGCAQKGRELVERSYRWDGVAERIGLIYEELLAK